MPELPTLVTEHLTAAAAAPRRRSALRVIHDGPLRQTVIALLAGEEMEEHNTPPAATVQVLHGRVRLTGTDSDVVLGAGALEPVPQARHGLVAVDDAVVLLTAVNRE
ncbi:cupin [Georgenia sp. TF02-10]|uniref:cupin n=1 Tax=Georgenia sp. TF02-10 TaxID=2917725 RepID=UPI001FA71465|nr:cupin [Georgenia sp. TF02-10]UNX54657.1 cupin [Georgenia sp. TF02-10]